VAAWQDEGHVEEMRSVYAAKRQIVLDLFRKKGIRVAGAEATFFLWVEVPSGETSEAFAGRLLEHGVVVSPGSFFGQAGEGYVRLALVPTIEQCSRAAAILDRVL
ncbi:MAG: aminotransferase class I/II-fold pyridoxal phosphate-dependent enzyme, partial [Chloroflexota bacterium]